MTPQLLERLGLLANIKCMAIIKENTLCIGPIVGAFVSKSYIDKLLKKQLLRKRTMELIKANQEAHTLLYFFSLNDVNDDGLYVNGTYYDHDDKLWKRERLPFPDVLYDRGSGIQRSLLPLQQFRSKMEETPIKKLNAQHYFNKWDLHKRLSTFPEMQAHLPHTILYSGKEDIKNMVQNYNKVYVKKIVSSNGRKILCIEKLPNSSYHCSTFTNKVMTFQPKNIDQVNHLIQKMYGKKGIILQEGIDLLTTNDRNIDMRATLQRRDATHIEITAIAIRIGGKYSPVTSTRTGSKCYRFEDFFVNKLKLSNEKFQRLTEKVHDFLFKVYRCTEEAYGTFGEIGIDFALNKQGKIQFIECNAKPAKSSLYKAYDQQTIRKAFRYPLDYAKFVSGFTVEG